jgi:ribosomal protein S6
MKTYELSYIVSPEITSEEAQAKAKELESAILAKEGTVLKQSAPVAKTLSYPVGKRASGFFGILEFQIEAEKLPELQEMLSKDGKIVRHMLIIKQAANFKKERRVRTKPELKIEIQSEKPIEIEIEKKEKPAEEEPSSAKASEAKPKVELKDIEEELDQILGK